MVDLQFFIRHKENFLQDKFILVFKSNEARDYCKHVIEGCRFEEVTSEQARHAVRIGINGKTVPYGYTYKLTDDEMNKLSIQNWEETAELLAEGNERMYKDAKNKGAAK